ncbi:MAG TPA: PIG-L family deacetylase [Terracidiphilus sp.]|nr:PIG-L family deacetylase [Terracidiphilus sp.]
MSITRREMVANSSKLALGLAATAPSAQVILGAQPAENPSAGKFRIVICGGHPGDPEYGCGGTIARLTSHGHDVSLLYLNQGDWPPTSIEVRLSEAQKACEILKSRRLYAGQLNSSAIVDANHYEVYRNILEQQRPDAVLTHWPLDNHRDHRACSTLTYDAWLHMNKSFSLYYYEVSNGDDTQQFVPAYYVDFSAFEPVKRAACYAHASQSPDRFYTLQDSVAAFRGIESGYKRAEAFLLQRGCPRDVLPIALAS